MLAHAARVLLMAALLAPPLASAGAGGGILVIGDSISAGYGVPAGAGWVDLLAQRLAAEGLNLPVVNASVSGDTTQGGATRIEAALARHGPAVVIIELGGNDGLRGYPLDRTRDNLRSMIERARAAGARVLLLGMRIPPNYGPVYTRRFHALYRELHERLGVAYVPFLLDGVATDTTLMQDDGIHPTARAQPLLLENLWPALRELLEQAQER